MIRSVRHGEERKEEIYEPVEWPPRRRSEPEPEREREPIREPSPEPRRKREKAPA
jgi:hypothetical protein